jgi:lysophospholipase L1-like esterase
MKKIVFICFYTAYLIFLFGFVLHTSANPLIFGKYTWKYLLFLIGLIILFFPFLWLVWSALQTTKIHFKKKIYTIKPYQKVLLLVFLFVLFILLPAEIVLRNKYTDYESSTYLYTIDNFHPFLQFQPAPNKTLPIDSSGFRGEGITKNKPANTYRIFVLGGSTVYNGSIPYEQTFARILEEKLQKKYPDKKVEVLNAGIDGYTTEHSLIQYQFKIKDFHPDLIIMWHGINDWYYSCSPKTYSFSSYQFDYSHFLGADAKMVFDRFTLPPVFQLKLVSWDFFLKAMQDNWYSDFWNWEKKNHPVPGIYADVNKNKTYEMKTFPSLPSYKRNIISLIQATRDDHVKLLLGNQAFLYHTNLSQQEMQTLLFPKIDCTNADGKYPNLYSMITAMNTYNQTMQDVAVSNNTPFVDLASALPKNLSYFTDDVHYTPLANKRIANILYKNILDNKLIESSER